MLECNVANRRRVCLFVGVGFFLLPFHPLLEEIIITPSSCMEEFLCSVFVDRERERTKQTAAHSEIIIISLLFFL